MKDLSYDERMHRLRLPSLELRRLHLDLIFGYKVVFGLVGVNTDDFFEFNHAANTRGHAYMMMMTIYCTVLLINFMVNEDFRKQGRWFFGIEETKLLTARR